MRSFYTTYTPDTLFGAWSVQRMMKRRGASIINVITALNLINRAIQKWIMWKNKEKRPMLHEEAFTRNYYQSISVIFRDKWYGPDEPHSKLCWWWKRSFQSANASPLVSPWWGNLGVTQPNYAMICDWFMHIVVHVNLYSQIADKPEVKSRIHTVCGAIWNLRRQGCVDW